MIFNPWKRIAQLEAELATAEQNLEYERESAQRHVTEAVFRIVDREVHRRMHLEAQNAYLMKQMTNLQSLSFPQSIIATMNGDDNG